jgi:dihydroorotase
MTDLTIKRPDDWHLHLQDGDMMKAVLPFTADLYGRMIDSTVLMIFS